MVMLATNVAHHSTDPRIVVENKLEPGQYRLRLVVVDDSGNASLPADVVITVGPKRISPINPDILTRPDIFVRPGVITRPVNPAINPGILNPLRPRRPGG